MTKKEMKEILQNILNEEEFILVERFGADDDYYSAYLGSFLDLDPCRRFHCVISPNGISRRCENYWKNLGDVASKLNCWIEGGDVDGLDVFLCTGNQPSHVFPKMQLSKEEV